MSYVPTLKKLYNEQVAPELVKSRGYKNKHEVPKLTKISLNTGIDADADKNQINQVVISSMLRAAGHECDIAKDGGEAIAFVQKGSYDGVLMDIQMPVIDGVEATRTIRTLGDQYQKLPIIALTANAMAGDE